MKPACIVFGVALVLEGAQSFCLSTSSAFARSVVTTKCSATLDGRKLKGEIQPTNNMVFVKIADEVEETSGGLILSGKSKIKKNEGTVTSVGPGRTDQESGFVFDMPISPGESVVYGKYLGQEVDYNGEKHILISDYDVLVKFAGGDLTLDNAETVWDSVLVKPEIKEEEESAGGILIAKGNTGKSGRASVGEVIKVGPGRPAKNGVLMEMDVAVGDMIKFRDFSTSEVEIQDETYMVVRMTDILCKF